MEDMPAMWTTYISTDDVEATVARVEAAGGSVMMPFMQVFESGQMAVLADPTGAAFSIWKAGDHIGAEIGNVANTMSWNELMTRDVDAALPFYAAVFGWTYDAMDMGPMGTYNLIKGGTDDEGLGGIISMPPGVPDQAPNHWGVYFTVDDIAAAVQTVTGSGGTVVQEPFEVPGIGTQAVVHDPQHGAFSLMQPGG
jgi:predicted enzyme related to lactoylglutathione lyase